MGVYCSADPTSDHSMQEIVPGLTVSIHRYICHSLLILGQGTCGLYSAYIVYPLGVILASSLVIHEIFLRKITFHGNNPDMIQIRTTHVNIDIVNFFRTF